MTIKFIHEPVHFNVVTTMTAACIDRTEVRISNYFDGGNPPVVVRGLWIIQEQKERYVRPGDNFEAR